MQISRRRFARAKKGTTKFQATFRGVQTRRLLAAIKVETYFRKCRANRAFKMLRRASIALQCKIRVSMAKKVVAGLKGEQKNIGKLQENNERLKMEMNSLKAMLAAQAKEGASNAAHSNELKLKQEEITKLENRIAELEAQLSEQKALVVKLEVDMQKQREQAAHDLANAAHRRQRSAGPHSPKHSKAATVDPGATPQMPLPPSDYVSPDVLAKHKKKLSKLEKNLRAEKKLRQEADGEIIKLRAALNGVQLSEAEIKDLLSKKQEETKTTVRTGETPEIAGAEPEQPKSSLARAMEGISSTFGGGEKPKEKPKMSMDYLLPKIRRGSKAQESNEDTVVVGWKADVKSRKQREEVLRDDVHRFESHMKGFVHSLEDGVDKR
ncbi:unnamed protein product [Pseudo-nitzschia multistriata]|uniref:Myosin motor domain-containing protein n=1 Tax=Pseudo-nitzschia multistriata TaxID=183589 RepID=A0A448ZSF1_9STRA|nr:unnamed protein product [Pseudo-nitzschia multistriata]